MRHPRDLSDQGMAERNVAADTQDRVRPAVTTRLALIELVVQVYYGVEKLW